MTHYEVLGVADDATTEEIRRVYLGLARRHHPDVHRSGGGRAAAEAEARMREVNAAWAVLGDADRRAAYDERLARDWGGTTPSQADAPITRPSTTFVPRRPDVPDDPDEDDDWRYEPDEQDPATVPPRLLLMAPPAAFAGGIGLLVLGLVTSIRTFAALGLICLLASALLFVGAPVVALFRSQMQEERVRRRR